MEINLAMVRVSESCESDLLCFLHATCFSHSAIVAWYSFIQMFVLPNVYSLDQAARAAMLSQVMLYGAGIWFSIIQSTAANSIMALCSDSHSLLPILGGSLLHCNHPQHYIICIRGHSGQASACIALHPNQRPVLALRLSDCQRICHHHV